MFDDFFIFLVPIFSILSVFVFLVVIVWTRQRRREREAYYRHELAKAMISRGADADEVVRMLRKSSSRVAERREALKLGGLLTLAIGVGFMLGFQWIPTEEPIWKIGFVPALLGGAMLAYAFMVGAGAGTESNGG
jgi:hypothetical protein